MNKTTTTMMTITAMAAAIGQKAQRAAKAAKALVAAAALLLPLAFAFPAAAALEPMEVADDLAARHNRIVGELKQLHDNGTLTQESALALMQEHASPKLDFAKLVQKAMGKHWRKADKEAKAKLRKVFRQLLENSYARLLTEYAGQEIKLSSATARSNGGASVILELQGAQKATLEYVCREVTGGGYVIDDIKIESVSMVATYRRQFGAIIKKSGINGLIDDLQKKAAELAPPPGQ